jgi:arabinofuranosyltransferase
LSASTSKKFGTPLIVSMSVMSRVGMTAAIRAASRVGSTLGILSTLGVLLLWHAAGYDFFCDDGYIALRYSYNLLEHGELAYNPKERVEGFTSPLWVLLVALLGSSGASLVVCAKVLGGASALGTLAVTKQLWQRLAPQHAPHFAFAVVGLLAAAPPFAAWALGGLEAPLFALGITSTLVLLARACDAPSIRSWCWCGFVAALSGLARPEGMALALLCVGVAALQSGLAKKWTYVASCALPILLLLGGYLAFRLSYYGYPFPNTYYVKTSGGGSELRKRGIKYVLSMANQFGWPTVAALGVAMCMPLIRPRRFLDAWSVRPSVVVLAISTRVVVAAFVVYLIKIGGDFLDLYRFMVPILPLAFCLIVSELLSVGTEVATFLRSNPLFNALLSKRNGDWILRLAGSVAMCVLLFSYGQHSLWMGVRSAKADWYEIPHGAPKRPNSVEPVAWTRNAALSWAALGRALRKHAKRGDTMALGAAGAAPFTSRLPNLDLYGLTDSWVSHHGSVVGSRPGHQRFAPRRYIRKWKPTYLFLKRRNSPVPEADEYWNKVGYVSATLKVSKKLHGASETHYVPVLVRKGRIESLRKFREWRFL